MQKSSKISEIGPDIHENKGHGSMHSIEKLYIV